MLSKTKAEQFERPSDGRLDGPTFDLITFDHITSSSLKRMLAKAIRRTSKQIDVQLDQRLDFWWPDGDYNF